MALSLERYKSSESSIITSILKKRNERARKKSTTVEIKNGDVFPEHMIVEILSWLPVKALLQFKVACKTWYDIITSSHFIYNKHLKNYYAKTDSWRDCLLAHYLAKPIKLEVIELLVEKTNRVLAFETLRNIPNYGWFICGPCDGLYYTYDWFSGNKRALWNPALNEFKALPPIITNPNLPSNRTHSELDTYGFGSDPITKDYKVIVLKEYWKKEHQVATNDPLSVFIYSFKSNSWRYWGDLDKYYYIELTTCTCYTFVNGTFYWLGSLVKHAIEYLEVIVSFDMVLDTYHEIQLPDYYMTANKNLGIYHDLIAFYAVYHEFDKIFVIWTFSEGIWTKKFTMTPLPKAYYPIGHWKDNKILLEIRYKSSSECGLVLCDPDTREMRDLGVKWKSYFRFQCHGVFAYRESLVSIEDHRCERG